MLSTQTLVRVWREKKFNNGRDDTLYASTPPLEALRVVISWAAAKIADGSRREVMINDVSRAYFNAQSTRDIYIEIPEEDTEKEGDQIGKLNVCLYGTRDAAKSWQDTLAAHLEKHGFTSGKACPSVFYHKERQIKTLVHGDDYVSSGYRKDLIWLQQKLEEYYEIKSQRIGDSAGCTREGRVLNKIGRAHV